MSKIWEIVPESRELLQRRLEILNLVKIKGIVGRKLISQDLEISERQIRNEAYILADLGLITQNSTGLSITQKGIELLRDFSSFLESFDSLKMLEVRLKEILKIKDVVVIKNGSDQEKLLTESSIRKLSKMLKNTKVLGITGGSSVASIVRAYPEKFANVEVVAARGSIGSSTHDQANTVGSILAGKLGAKFYPLFTPDTLSSPLLNSIKDDPIMVQTLNKISMIDTLVFGIGRSDVMAKMRHVDEKYLEMLQKNNAIAESFGYYFNDNGQVIDQISSFGISIERYKSLERILALAYSKEKARAIIAVSHINHNLTLVTDESCAKEIIRITGGNNG